jgi:hypothetical protein
VELASWHTWSRRIGLSVARAGEGLYEGIGNESPDVGSRFVVQPLGSETSGAYPRIPEGPPQVPRDLRVVRRLSRLAASPPATDVHRGILC